MRIIEEFKEFVNRGNVMDLAVAVIIGSAFQNIVNSIVNDLIMPLIAVVGGWAKLDDLRFGPFNYGKLIANILHFLIVAFVLFLVVKALNRAKEIIVKEEAPAEKPKDS
jgi:large conductance mechanosensitive channel